MTNSQPAPQSRPTRQTYSEPYVPGTGQLTGGVISTGEAPSPDRPQEGGVPTAGIPWTQVTTPEGEVLGTYVGTPSGEITAQLKAPPKTKEGFLALTPAEWQKVQRQQRTIRQQVALQRQQELATQKEIEPIVKKEKKPFRTELYESIEKSQEAVSEKLFPKETEPGIIGRYLPKTFKRKEVKGVVEAAGRMLISLGYDVPKALVSVEKPKEKIMIKDIVRGTVPKRTEESKFLIQKDYEKAMGQQAKDITKISEYYAAPETFKEKYKYKSDKEREEDIKKISEGLITTAGALVLTAGLFKVGGKVVKKTGIKFGREVTKIPLIEKVKGKPRVITIESLGISREGRAITLRRKIPPEKIKLTELTEPVAIPETAVQVKAFKKAFELTPKETTRLTKISEAIRLGRKEKGLPVKDLIFKLEQFKDPYKSSKIIERSIAKEGGVVFGSVTTEMLPKGFRVKPQDIDIIFPTLAEPQVAKVISELSKKLQKAKEPVRVSKKNPLIIESAKSEKLVEAKAGVDPTKLSGLDEISGKGAFGFEFPDIKKAQIGKTVKLGEVKAITVGEQQLRKAAASTFFRPKDIKAPKPFQEAGVFPRGARTKDIADLLTQSLGIAEIQKAAIRPTKKIKGLLLEKTTKEIQKTFTLKQQRTINELIKSRLQDGEIRFKLDVPKGEPSIFKLSKIEADLVKISIAKKVRGVKPKKEEIIVKDTQSVYKALEKSVMKRIQISPSISPRISPRPSKYSGLSPSTYKLLSPRPSKYKIPSPRPSPKPSPYPSPKITPSPYPRPSPSMYKQMLKSMISPKPSPIPDIVTTFKPPKTPIALWKRKRKVKQLLEKKVKSKKSLYYIPDFTSKVLGLTKEITKAQARALLKQKFTPFEIRKGVILK